MNSIFGPTNMTDDFITPGARIRFNTVGRAAFEVTYLGVDGDRFMSFQWGESERTHQIFWSDITTVAVIDEENSIRTDHAIKLATYGQIHEGDRVHIKTTGGARFEADVVDTGDVHQMFFKTNNNPLFPDGITWMDIEDAYLLH